MLYFRIKLPNFVFLGSLSVLQPVSSVPVTRMLRNLYMRKGFLSFPTRSCRNKTGPGLESRTPTAAASIRGLVNIIRTKAPAMSMHRLHARSSTLSSGWHAY